MVYLIFFVVIMVLLLVTLPFHSYLVSQYIFNSPGRTRRKLLYAYNFYKKNYPNASEKELFWDAMNLCFKIVNKEPDKHKPFYCLASKEVQEMIETAGTIDELITLVIKRGLSPNIALCGF
jgi:hypothetical protein